MISILSVISKSMVTKKGTQRIDFTCRCDQTKHLLLNVRAGDKSIIEGKDIAFSAGEQVYDVYIPVIEKDIASTWQITDNAGTVLCEKESILKKPRQWTMYAMVSSHTDIGLHNSQYIQRYNSSKFLDMAMKLADETETRDINDRYRYTMEGTWFWNNYGMDRGRDAAKAVVSDYIKKGKIGACAGVAGNHTQTYGMEEVCRAAYEKDRLFKEWGIESETMSMIDNNGISMGVIQPCVDSGYKNIIFAPNQWNPIQSTIWKSDRKQNGYQFTPNAGGGGSRIDVRYDSELPMVFWWEDENANRLLVWCSTQYGWGGAPFGLYTREKSFFFFSTDDALSYMEENIAERLTILEKKYPFDVWLFACYGDDQEPELYLTDRIKAWNEKWEWPQIRTLGNPDEPFNILRKKYSDQIPVLRGDITGGWYQHPLSVPEIMAQKFETDSLLPVAEKWSSIASLIDEEYKYPKEKFRHAWDYLLYNDEHSYGTSGYQGRRVYETWMQHRDWIEKALCTAEEERDNALRSIASKIKSDEDKVVVFNSTAQKRCEYIKFNNKYFVAEVPPFGYKTVSKKDLQDCGEHIEKTDKPPVIENMFYRVEFSENGSVKSIVDKELKRELLDLNASCYANEIMYTRDNHKTFTKAESAEFEIVHEKERIEVVVKTKEVNLRAKIVQRVILQNREKRIDIDNMLYGVSDMVNTNRYYRYIYFAFPFNVDKSKRYCHLNGTVGEYAKSVTGHGTDVYMAANEWCCAENDEFGVALMMKDSQLVEFDHIHPDKTDFGNAGDGSQMFSYVANDWLQMHTPGGSHLNYRFRYSITSYTGNYKKAGIPEMAERYLNPLHMTEISKQNGFLNDEECSFLLFNSDMRFICLKYAEDESGLILRMYGDENEDFEVKSTQLGHMKVERVTVDERNTDNHLRKGMVTYRLTADNIKLNVRDEKLDLPSDRPAPIGSVYTGLITKPRAACGEDTGHIYLLWGANTEKDFSHYKLYRSEQPGFEANEKTFIADVYPEEYVVGRYEDKGLKEHTCYYYRICAVNKKGACGMMSDEFNAFTKEVIEKE